MRQTGIALCLATLLSLSLASANEQAQEAQAEDKAESLEQSHSADDERSSPTQAETLTEIDAQVIDPQGEDALDDPLTCLARSIYWESKGQKTSEMEAVANVVMNRLSHEKFPDTVCEVVKEGGEQGTCQFSWWCDGRPDEIAEEDAYEQAKEVARLALNGELSDRTQGALFFHQRTVAPHWGKSFPQIAETGNFLFYTYPEEWSKPE